MPKHYAVGKNVQEYEIFFDNTKTAYIVFDTPFTLRPIVQLTMANSGNLPAYKHAVTTNGCIIKFKTRYIGTVAAVVMEK